MRSKRVILADLFFTQSDVGQVLPSTDPRHVGYGWHDVSDIREAVVMVDGWNESEPSIYWSLHLLVTPDDPMRQPNLAVWREARMPVDNMGFITYRPEISSDETYFRVGLDVAWSNVWDQVVSDGTYKRQAAFYRALPFNFVKLKLQGGPWTTGSDGQNLRVTLIGK